MDPTDISSLNELLDRITTLGVTTDYDLIGLKPDQREIMSPPVTHLVTVVEGQVEDTAPPMLKTNYVWISELREPDAHLRETIRPPNIELGFEPKDSQDTPDPGPLNSEVLQNPDSIVRHMSDLIPPAHHKQYSPSNSGPPDICHLMYIRQQPQETVHHFGARFLLVKNKIKDFCDD